MRLGDLVRYRHDGDLAIIVGLDPTSRWGLEVMWLGERSQTKYAREMIGRSNLEVVG